MHTPSSVDALVAREDVAPAGLIGYIPIPLAVYYRQSRQPTFEYPTTHIWNLDDGLATRHVAVDFPDNVSASLEDLEPLSDMVHVYKPVVAYCREQVESAPTQLASATDWKWDNDTLRLTALRYVNVLPLDTETSDSVVRACVGLFYGALELTRVGTADPWGMVFVSSRLKVSTMSDARGSFNAHGFVFATRSGVAVMAVFNNTTKTLRRGEPLHIMMVNVIDANPDFSCHIRYLASAQILANNSVAALTKTIKDSISNLASMVYTDTLILLEGEESPDTTTDARRNWYAARFARLSELGVVLHEDRERVLGLTIHDKRAETNLLGSFIYHLLLKLSCVSAAIVDQIGGESVYLAVMNLFRVVESRYPWVRIRNPTCNLHLYVALMCLSHPEHKALTLTLEIYATDTSPALRQFIAASVLPTL